MSSSTHDSRHEELRFNYSVIWSHDQRCKTVRTFFTPHAAGLMLRYKPGPLSGWVCFMKCEIEDGGFSVRSGSWQITMEASAWHKPNFLWMLGQFTAASAGFHRVETPASQRLIDDPDVLYYKTSQAKSSRLVESTRLQFQDTTRLVHSQPFYFTINK